MSNALPDGLIRIHLNTKSRFSAQIAGRMIEAAAESIEGNNRLANPTKISLVEVGEASWWVHLLILGGSVGGAIFAIEGLAEEIREGRTPFARHTAGALGEGDGDKCTLSAGDEHIEIPAGEIPSLQIVEADNDDRIEPVDPSRDFRSEGLEALG